MTHSTALKKKKLPKNHTTHFCSYKTAKPRFLPQSRIVTDGGKAGERAFFSSFIFHIIHVLATHCCHRVVESSFTGNLLKLEQLIKLLMQTWLKNNDMRPERFSAQLGNAFLVYFYTLSKS